MDAWPEAVAFLLRTAIEEIHIVVACGRLSLTLPAHATVAWRMRMNSRHLFVSERRPAWHVHRLNLFGDHVHGRRVRCPSGLRG